MICKLQGYWSGISCINNFTSLTKEQQEVVQKFVVGTNVLLWDVPIFTSLMPRLLSAEKEKCGLGMRL